MSSAEYTRLPTHDIHADDDDETRPRSYRDDPRFVEPTPAAWKRVALILFLFFLAWAGYKLRTMGAPREMYVYADR